MKIRKFSIPYNGTDPNTYINAINPYMDYIDSIFLGLPSLLSWSPQHQKEEIKEVIEANTLEFLSKEVSCKRFLALNRANYNMTNTEMQDFCKNQVFPIITKYHIEGITVSDYNMAKYIHQYMPELELNASCNAFLYNTHAMRIWQEKCNISVFTPSRDLLRMPEQLKKIHNEGFKIMGIVNGSCLFGCTQQLIHCFNIGKNSENYCFECNQPLNEEILKCNWILPRWLKYLDEYIDIYKITGRRMTTQRIISILNIYINEQDNITIDDFISGNVRKGIHLNIPTNIIPDKLLTCECKDCNKGCNLCKEIIEQLGG